MKLAMPTVQRRPAIRFPAALLAVLLLPAFAAPRAAAQEERKPPADPAAPAAPEKVKAAVTALERAPSSERPRAAVDLIALGPEALAETRAARDRATDPGARAALDRASRWILAAKLRPVLKERAETGLSYDGQYTDLKS